MKKSILAFLLFCVVHCINAQETITISGQATDFEGNPIDSCVVQVLDRSFEPLYEVYTDTNGHYKIENVEKGKYMGIYAIRPKEYPRDNAVPEKDMRLEFWAWNIIADRDLTINPRYHKLELYGTTVFEKLGNNSGYFVYFRPMSVTRYLSYSKENYLDKQKMEKMGVNISVNPELLNVKVFADGELLKINSIQPIEEFDEDITITGYIVQVDAPKVKTEKPYIIFRVEAENKEHNEKGENLYFYELPDFK